MHKFRITSVRNIYFKIILFVMAVSSSSYCLESNQRLIDSIIKLMYDSPSARDTIINWYEMRLEKSSISYHEKRIQTSLGRSHILIWGDTNKQPLVLIHGGNANATLWLDMVPYLTKNFCLYAPDVIGDPTGKTVPYTFPVKRTQYTIWLKEVLDSLKLNKPYLAGHSFGSLVAMDYTIQNPNSVKNLILISPPAGIAKTNFSAILKLMSIYFFSGKNFPDKTLDALRSPSVKSSAELYSYFEYLMNHCKQGFPMPWYCKDDELHRIQTKTLLLIGSDEFLINSNAAFKRAKRLIADVNTQLIKNAGHSSICDNPGDISESIVKFCTN